MNEIIDKFNELYGTYQFPFEKADQKLEQMKEPERLEYYREARDINNGRVWKMEMEEIILQFYQDMALKVTTELEQHAHRLTLIALQKLSTRMAMLSQRLSSSLEPKSQL